MTFNLIYGNESHNGCQCKLSRPSYTRQIRVQQQVYCSGQSVHCFIAPFIKQQPAYIGAQKEQEGYLPQTDRASAFVHQNVWPG